MTPSRRSNRVLKCFQVPTLPPWTVTATAAALTHFLLFLLQLHAPINFASCSVFDPHLSLPCPHLQLFTMHGTLWTKKKKTLPQTVLRYSIRDQTEYDPAGGRRCFLMLHMNGNPWWEWSALEDNRRLYSSCELKKKKKKKQAEV